MYTTAVFLSNEEATISTIVHPPLQDNESVQSVAILPRAPRYLSIDIWRGVACVAVVLLHASVPLADAKPNAARFIGLLSLGVPMFFVISGYCIAATCDSARRRNRSFGWFMRRRFLRIFPPYWICLVLTAIAAIAFSLLKNGEIGYLSTLTCAQWVGNITLTERWRPRLFDDDQGFILGTAWTLCYEEQFYAVCGLALLVTRRHYFIGVAAITALTVPLTILNWAGAVNLQGFFFDGYWLQFASGLLVYHARNYAGDWGLRASIGLLLILAVCAMACRLLLPSAVVWGYSRAGFLDGTILALSFASFLLIFQCADARIASAAILKPVGLCGVMCYSLYLAHLPVVEAVHLLVPMQSLSFNGDIALAVIVVLSFVISLLAGICFYFGVERHFLNRAAE